jgi:hypothetical protein
LIGEQVAKLKTIASLPSTNPSNFGHDDYRGRGNRYSIKGNNQNVERISKNRNALISQ